MRVQWRSSLVLVGLLLVASPAAAAPDVVWPTDLDASFAARGAAFARALDLEARFVVYASEGSAWEALQGTAYDKGRSSVQTRADDASLVVDVLHPDGHAYRYSVPVHEVQYRITTGRSGGCMVVPPSPTPCVYQESFENRTARVVEAADLPVGVSIDGLNRMTIEGPPGTFAAYGSSLLGARAVALRLGIPWAWDASDFMLREIGPTALRTPTPDYPAAWWVSPGVDRVPCSCLLWRLRDGDARGAGEVWFVTDEAGQLLQFGSTVWLQPNAAPRLSAEDALFSVQGELEARGVDRFRTNSTELAYLRLDGFAWRVVTIGESPTGAVFAEWFLNDATGGTIGLREYDAAPTFRAPTAAWDKPVLPALLVAVLAMTLILWHGPRRPGTQIISFPEPPERDYVE